MWVNVTESGTPEAYTTSYLRASRATWGDYSNSSGWIYSYGEEDWFTNSMAIARTKAGLLYTKNTGPTLSAIGFGWCYDMVETNILALPIRYMGFVGVEKVSEVRRGIWPGVLMQQIIL